MRSRTSLGDSPILSTLRSLKRLSLPVLVVSGLLFFWSARQKAVLPSPTQILPPLLKAPVQAATEKTAYEFAYGGTSYHINPRADYQIQGMVVTHNDISAFDDIYHNRNSVDVKDLCVIWGENLQDDSYQRITFWSEPWSCQFWSDDRGNLVNFRLDEISNNHLLSRSQSVRDSIGRVGRGDQITLKGQLIDYCPTNFPEQLRKTSLDRNDTGNGACEVLMVDSIQILKVNRPEWRMAWRVSRIIFFLSFALQVFTFVSIPILQLQKKKRETAEREEEYRRRMSGELLANNIRGPVEPSAKP